jgi:glycosyltransferase involved in cell wall biosynthesis
MKLMFIAEDISFPPDEGARKYNSFLLKYLIDSNMTIKLVTGSGSKVPVIHDSLSNKSFISTRLYFNVNSFKPDVIIYSPEASGTLFSFLRLFILGIYYAKTKRVLINLQRREHNLFSKRIIRILSPHVVVTFSKHDDNYFKKIGLSTLAGRVGVDTSQFIPVNAEQKLLLRNKYGYSDSDKIVLHIGHIKRGRNISILSSLVSRGYKVVLVGSTSTRVDDELRMELNEKGVVIFNEFISEIEELYQMSDVYVFPVNNMQSAIEFPLSVLEAMACNLPVVTTPYGSLPDYFTETPCFKFFVTENELTAKIEEVLIAGCDNRLAVSKKFSWDNIFEDLIVNNNLQW